MRWPTAIVSGLLAYGCVTLTPEGARVAVYKAQLSDPPATREMPAGCRKIGTLGQDRFSELEIEGQSDPYRERRNTVGSSGGNVLLVLMQQTSPRTNPECPNAVPIGDCAPYSGAWYKLVFESYDCTPDALRALSALSKSKPPPA